MLCNPLHPFALRLKTIRVAHAKEVGVGNPSEERATTRIKSNLSILLLLPF